MKRWIASLAVLGAACASPPSWEKQGATAQEFETDKGQCQAQAYSTPGMVPMQVAAVYNACMRGKGWRQVQD